MASSTPTRGLLFVTMQPKETLSDVRFHDWYNNEHGPNRTRLPFIPNGFRYRATDLEGTKNGTQDKPEYLAIYDITDMQQLMEEPYQYLRAPPGKTQREIDVMAQIWVDRMLFDFMGEKANDKTFVKLESPEHFEENLGGNGLTTCRFQLEAGQVAQAENWIKQSVIPVVETVPGWRRVSWFKNSYLEPRKDGKVEIVVIFEFTPTAEPKITGIYNNPPVELSNSKTRKYDLFYTFGGAARHLAIVAPWTHPDGVTKTIPHVSPAGSAIESTVTTQDGAVLPFRLEGNSADDSPVLVLVNSVLVTWNIWDRFIKHFFSTPENHKYRILRFLSRGRTFQSGTTSPVTVDLLASDIIQLLDSLRIPQAAALVGVSLGGATTLATALKYPARIKSFVSCDTSAKSPAGNKDAWGQRIAVAEEEGKTLRLASASGDESSSASPQPVVGEELAELTVRRWFVPESYDDPSIVPEIEKVKHMVFTNSLAEFSRGVEALFDYDYTSLLPTYKGKGAFLVGAGDGMLPKGMEKLSKELGSAEGRSAEFKVVEAAGHLPMVEKPTDVAVFVSDFLAK
ncbi:alpha/beta hydrolase [Exophiala viscosa]|uniref:alpha/beta hydrolase n=1 Tax=Exophiala viscosa TaxID=2486360 RepID=UPI00218DA99A|nr:alpha/beta hydrolase [Exophiala viscosa]